ncbi:MAG: GAF domain-containing protein, partial [Thermoplasmatota archaeon]
MKILIVDDDQKILEQSKIFLKKKNKDLEVITESSGIRAIELLKSEKFDAIISDYKMPEISGIEILKRLRKKGNDTPFILLTGKGCEEIAIEALNHGADRYIQKEVDSDTLYDILYKAIIDEIEDRETEKELSRTRMIYEKIAKNLPNGLINIVDKDLNIFFSEGQALETLGYKHDDIIGKNIYDLFPHEKADIFASQIDKALEGKTVHFEDSIEGLHFISNIVPFPDGDEERVIVLSIDTTEKEKAERARKETSRELSTLIDNLPGMVYRCKNTNGWPMVMVKGEVKELTGYTVSEIAGADNIWGKKIVHPEDSKRSWDVIYESIQNGSSFEVTYRILTKEGITKWVWEQGTAVEDEKGSVVALEGFITDITEKKETQEKLEENIDKIKDLHRLSVRLESIEEEQEVYDLIVSASENILDFNLCAVEIVEEDKFTIKSSSSDVPVSLDDTFPRIGLAEESYRTGKTIVSKDIQNDSRAAPDSELYRSGITIPIGTMGVFQITSDRVDVFDEQDVELTELLISNATEALERIRHEKSLKENRRKITELYKVTEKLEKCHSKDKIFDLALNTAKEILEFYHATIMVYEDGDLVVKRTNDEKLGTGVHLSVDEGFYGKTFRNKESYLIKNLRENEEAKPQREEFLSAMSFPLGDFGVFQTISTEEDFYDKDDLEIGELLTSHIAQAIQRVEFEEHLQKSEMRYRNLFEYSPISLWEEDFSGVFQFFDDLRDRGINDIKGYLNENPDEIKRCANLVKIEGVNQSTLDIYEAESKEQFLGNLNDIFTERSFKTFKEQLYILIEGGSEFSGEAENRTLKGNKIDIFIKWVVVKGHEKDYSRVLVSIIDITERKKAKQELKEYKDHLEDLVEERTQELKEMNEYLKAFTHSVSHDLRAPLRALQGFSRALMEDHGDVMDEESRYYLQRIDAASKRMELLISDLLEYSKLTRTEIKFESVDVNEMLEIILDELSRQIDKENA